MNIIKQRVPTGAVIFRGKPVHLAHLWVTEQALNLCEKVVIVVGSSWRSRNPKNPFVFAEVKEMLLRSLSASQRERVHIVGVRDVYNDERWVSMVRAKVEAFAVPGHPIHLVGFLKDASSYYLQRFPSWKFVDAGSNMNVNATDLRHLLFGAGLAPEAALSEMSPFMHPGALDFLSEWARTSEYGKRCAEHLANEAYRVKYPGPAYHTGDAVIEAANHFLMIERDGVLGTDLFAFPGGHSEKGESGLEAALRETGEETTLGLTRQELLSALAGQHVFDSKSRSPRGHIITTACHFRLPGFTADTLPKVYGRDDAKNKRLNWFTRSQFADRMHLMFDDHDVIGERFMGEMQPTVELA